MDNIVAPAPVPLDRLVGILAQAKKVMKASDQIAPPSLSERMSDKALAPRVDEDVEYLTELPPNQPQRTIQQPMEINPNMVKSSKLPESIKRIMIEKPIDKVTMNHTFRAEDVASLMEDYEEKKTPYLPPINKKQPIRESRESSTNLSEDRIREILKEEVHNYMTNVYNKSLTEKVVKETIGTLLKEGVIRKKL